MDKQNKDTKNKDKMDKDTKNKDNKKNSNRCMHITIEGERCKNHFTNQKNSEFGTKTELCHVHSNQSDIKKLAVYDKKKK